jgi:hypothetical protein
MLLTDLPDDVIGRFFNFLRKGSSTCCPGTLDSPDALSLSSASRRLRRIYAQTCLKHLRLDLCERHASLSRAAALCRIAGRQLLRVTLITRNTSGIGIATAVPLHVLLDVWSRHCLELQAIDLTQANNLNWHSCSHAFRRLLHVCSKLKSLHIGSVPQGITRLIAAAGHRYNRTKEGSSCIELQELSLLDFSQGMDDLFRVVAPFQTVLRKLSISGGSPNDVRWETKLDSFTHAMAPFCAPQPLGKLELLHIGPMLYESAITKHVIRSLVLSSRLTLKTLALEQIDSLVLDKLMAQEIWKCRALKEVQLHRFDTTDSLQYLFKAIGGHLTTLSTLRPSSENEIRALRQFCPSIRALSLTFSSACSPLSISEISEYNLLVHALRGSLEFLSLTKVRTLNGMNFAEYATNLKHLRLHFDVEPDFSAIELLLRGCGKYLRSLNLHIRGLGTFARNTLYLLRLVEQHCSDLTMMELNLWSFEFLSNMDWALQESYLGEFEAAMPNCCTKWTRAHLRAAQKNSSIQNYMRR